MPWIGYCVRFPLAECVYITFLCVSLSIVSSSAFQRNFTHIKHCVTRGTFTLENLINYSLSRNNLGRKMFTDIKQSFIVQYYTYVQKQLTEGMALAFMHEAI